MSKFDIYSRIIYECGLPRAQTAPRTWDTILPGPKAKLPGYVPGADPCVTTPPPACVIQFVVC